MSSRAREKIEKGVFRIGGMVYAERSKDGKMHRRKAPMQGSAALNAKGKPTPALRTWLKQFAEQVDNEKWVELELSKQRSSSPTLKELAEIYLEIAAVEYTKTREPKPASATQNASSLLRVAKACGVKEDDRVDGLTADAIEKWVADYCAKNAERGLDRARTSAWSQIAQAKSVWTAWTRPCYESRNVKLPECLFAWPTPKRNFAQAYRRPPEALREATVKWYNNLERILPGSWAAATLMMQFAMRPGDACALTWDNITENGDTYTLRYVPQKTHGRTEKPRAVTWPVSADLYARLKKAGGIHYVVPGDSPTVRYNVYQTGLNPMMRNVGWDEETYDKACYELRKLCIDAVYRKFGIERAVQISGDNAQTILRYYADPQIDGLAPVDISAIVCSNPRPVESSSSDSQTDASPPDPSTSASRQ